MKYVMDLDSLPGNPDYRVRQYETAQQAVDRINPGSRRTVVVEVIDIFDKSQITTTRYISR